MDAQHLQTAYFHASCLHAPCVAVMSDPEWIALESIDEETTHFIFDDTMLHSLENRGLVEPSDGHWRVTADGQRALHRRSF